MFGGHKEKRNQFHIEIRRKEIETILSKKRQVQMDDAVLIGLIGKILNTESNSLIPIMERINTLFENQHQQQLGPIKFLSYADIKKLLSGLELSILANGVTSQPFILKLMERVLTQLSRDEFCLALIQMGNLNRILNKLNKVKNPLANREVLNIILLIFQRLEVEDVNSFIVEGQFFKYLLQLSVQIDLDEQQIRALFKILNSNFFLKDEAFNQIVHFVAQIQCNFDFKFMIREAQFLLEQTLKFWVVTLQKLNLTKKSLNDGSLESLYIKIINHNMNTIFDREFQYIELDSGMTLFVFRFLRLQMKLSIIDLLELLYVTFPLDKFVTKILNEKLMTNNYIKKEKLIKFFQDLMQMLEKIQKTKEFKKRLRENNVEAHLLDVSSSESDIVSLLKVQLLSFVQD